MAVGMTNQVLFSIKKNLCVTSIDNQFYPERSYKMLNPVNLSASEFAEKIKADKAAIIIDVRTPQEYNISHIPNSILIDFYHHTFQSKIMELDKKKTYYLYCRSGNRSFYAGNFMLKMGFEKVHHLENGIITWQGAIEV